MASAVETSCTTTALPSASVALSALVRLDTGCPLGGKVSTLGAERGRRTKSVHWTLGKIVLGNNETRVSKPFAYFLILRDSNLLAHKFLSQKPNLRRMKSK